MQKHPFLNKGKIHKIASVYAHQKIIGLFTEGELKYEEKELTQWRV